MCCRWCSTVCFFLAAVCDPVDTEDTRTLPNAHRQNILLGLLGRVGGFLSILKRDKNIVKRKVSIRMRRYESADYTSSSQLYRRSVMSSSVEGMMWENILYLFPNLGIWTIRQDGIWGTNGEGNIGVTEMYRGKSWSTLLVIFAW